MSKYTDEQIIKALECCAFPGRGMCAECPMKSECEENPFVCTIARYALSAIKERDVKIYERSKRILELNIDLDSLRGSADFYKQRYEELLRISENKE